MSTTTMGLWARMTGALEARSTAKKGLFGRMLERAIAAREAEARRRCAEYLRFLSDDRLKELGMGARDIQLMRDTGRVPPTNWS